MKKTVRIAGPANVPVAASSASICNPATGRRAVIRYIKATNCDTSATHYLCLSVGAIATVANRFVDQIPIVANGEYGVFVQVPIEAGEDLCSAADTTGKIALTVTGEIESLL
jgi:hypothetical protein